ncbi:MAG: hypothetical protein AABY07_08970 [Nanoarchaeota archaeon]
MALLLEIGPTGGLKTDYTKFMDFKSFSTENSLEVAADGCQFDIYLFNSALTRPEAGNEITFKDGATTEFAGIIISIDSISQGNELTIYHCIAFDYAYMLDRRLVNNEYTLSSVNTLLNTAFTDLRAGYIAQAILQDLYNSSEDDTYYKFFKDNVDQIEAGPIIRPIKFDKVLASQAFDTLSEASAMIWWVEFDKKFNFHLFLNNPATQLVDSELIVNSSNSTRLKEYFDYHEEENISKVGTQLILRDVKIRSIASTIDEFKGSEGKSHNAQDNKIFVLNNTPHTIADVVTVKKNTVNQNIKIEDVEGSPTGGEGGSTDVFVQVGPPSYVRFSNTNTVADADNIAVNYNYAITDDTEDVSTEGKLEMKRRTGGDGIHQFIYSQASGLKVDDLQDIDDVALMILNRKSDIFRQGEFNSWLKGWKAGQHFNRKWFKEVQEQLMYVTSVSKRIITPANDPNLLDNIIESRIIFSNIPHGVSV